MKHAYVIARRELGHRAFVFAAAAILAFVPFLAALMPSVRNFGAPNVVTTLAGFLAMAFTLGLAIALGVNNIGRDLTERRLSFYFSRPVSAAAIWFGKFAAAVVAIGLSLLAIFLPAYLYGAQAWGRNWNIKPATLLVALFASAIILYLLAHAMSTMARSKSPLLLLDFTLLLVTLGAGWLIVRPLLFGMAISLLLVIQIVVVTWITLTLALAGWWQLRIGRVDRRENHIALSSFIWSGAGLLILTAGGYVMWVTAATPRDLRHVDVLATGGRWATVTGPLHGRGDYRETFAYDVDSGAFVELGCAVCPTWLSRDGKRVAWAKPIEYKSRTGEVQVMSLEPRSKPRATGLMVGGWPNVEFTDDFSRGAVIERGVMSVRDLVRDRSLGTVRLPAAAARTTMQFVSHDLIRLFVTAEGDGDRNNERIHTTHIFEYDLRSRALRETGRFAARAKWSVALPGDDETLYVRNTFIASTSAFQQRDARTGALIAERRDIPFRLRDNRVILRDRSTLIVEGDGRQLKIVPVGPAERILILGEVAPGKVLISVHRGVRWVGPNPKPNWVSMLADVDRGAIVAQQPGLAPVSWWSWFRGFRDVSRDVHLFLNEENALVRWNPLTGEKRVLLGGKS